MSELHYRVAARFLQASYFSPGTEVLWGKYKNKRAKVIGFSSDKWGNPTIELEPIPKGRKKNVIVGLFKIWRADVKEKALAELAAQEPKMAAKKPDTLLYSGVILDEASQAALVRWWEKAVGPVLSETVAHHMTIQVKPSLGEAQMLPLGRKARLKVIGYVQDGKAQAVIVRPSVDSLKPTPHVTVAVASGAEASYSDALLTHGYERVNGPTLSGEVGVATRRRTFFDLRRLL